MPRVHRAHFDAAHFDGQNFVKSVNGSAFVHVTAPVFVVGDPVIKQLGVVSQDLVQRPCALRRPVFDVLPAPA